MTREEKVFALPSRFCESSWESNGEERTNCTSEDLNPDDLTKPCKLFIRELEFNKQLNNRRSENEKVCTTNQLALDKSQLTMFCLGQVLQFDGYKWTVYLYKSSH